MNERIKQLAGQAKLPSYVLEYGTELCLAPHLEKFAELLIQECIEQIWYTREDGINGNVSEVIKERITTHFRS